MRALIYARVSFDPKAGGRSVAEQEADCRAVCEREGWLVVDVLVDNDRSASRHARRDRPAWAKVKQAIASGDVDVLVTWEASRAQRDADAYIELRRLCSKAGVKWCYSGQLYDFNDRNDRFRTVIDAAIAERDADETRDRVLRAMRSNATKGRPHGRRLFGYRRVYDSATGELLGQEPDPGEAPLVAEAARRFLAGESASSIAAGYSARGVRGSWDLGRVRLMLTNPAYTGRRTHNGQVAAEPSWPAILNDDTFRALQARFADPARRRYRTGPNAHLLSGVARCGVCGGVMTYGQSTGHGRRYQFYTCRDLHCVSRNLAALEAYVTTTILDRMARPDAADATTDTASDEAAAAMAEVVDLQALLQSATDEFTEGRLTSMTLARVEAGLLPRIAGAERRARVIHLPTVAHDLAVADDPAVVWDALTVEQRREIVRALLDIVVDRTESRGRRGFDPSSVRIEWRR